MSRALSKSSALLLLIALALAGCNKSTDKPNATGGTGAGSTDQGGGAGKDGAGKTGTDEVSGKVVLKITGSDTMVNLAGEWAAVYHELHPNIVIEVKGGGSGVGIAALIDSKVDIATSSRPMKKEELDEAKSKSGKDPVEHRVGLDALAIYVHLNNPLDSISIEELAQVYGEGGTIETWDQLGVTGDKTKGEIVVVSRQNSSGTYEYFREAVIGKEKNFRQGMLTQSGSSDVVALVSRTPQAIGYSGMGYKDDTVKFLSVSKKKGETGIQPSIETAIAGTYPISRPLFLYTPGEATGAVKDFLDWVVGPDGQRVVKELGYVPLPK